MRPSQVATAIDACFKADLPPFLWGPPGVGKTALVSSLAEKYGPVHIVHGLTQEACDVSGFPYLVDSEGTKLTCFSRPGFWPKGEKGILFLDEFASAPGMVMTAFSQLLLGRRIGEHVLKPGWHIVLASNRMSDRAVVHNLPTPIANRCVHIDYECTWEEWKQWAMKNGVHEDVIGFLNFQPQLLHEQDFAKDKGKGGRPSSSEHAFCSPRSWDFASRLLLHSGCEGGEVEQQLLEGIVGKRSANDFSSFLLLKRKAPTMDEIIKNPKKAMIPAELSVRYAICLGLSRRMDKNTIGPIMTYLRRNEGEKNVIPADMAIMAAKTAVERDYSIQNTKEFASFVMEHASELGV